MQAGWHLPLREAFSECALVQDLMPINRRNCSLTRTCVCEYSRACALHVCVCMYVCVCLSVCVCVCARVRARADDQGETQNVALENHMFKHYP